jgi:hypothetical protein
VDFEQSLTEREREVLALYRAQGASNVRRTLRLSIQYSLGAAVLAVAGIFLDNPFFGLAVWAVLVAVLALRLMNARRLAGVMPGILDKYDRHVALLDDRLSAFTTTPEAAMQCCFCTTSIPLGTAIVLTISLGDGASQRLASHKACLTEAVHPSVPLGLDL